MKHLLGFITVAALAVTLASCSVNNEIEPNNTRGQATSIKQLTLGGTMDSSSDVDWFVLEGQEGYRANFEITHDNRNDFDFAVYSGNRRVGQAIGLNSGDEIDVSIPGKCYVKVWQSTGTGSYQISISPDN